MDPHNNDAAWQALFNEIVRYNESDLVELLTACRLYAYHCDTYVNSACRQQPFPLARLVAHFVDDVGFGWFSKYSGIPSVPRAAEICYELEDPFERFEDCKKNTRWFDLFLVEVRASIQRIYINFTELAISLPRVMTVYRCIRIPKGERPTLRLYGFSSTATNLSSAFQFGMYHYDILRDDLIVFEIQIPEETQIIPVDLCTIQKENEVVIVSNGILRVHERVPETLVYWNPVRDGDGVEQTNFPVPYTRMKCTFHITDPFPDLYPFTTNPPSFSRDEVQTLIRTVKDDLRAERERETE